MVVAVGGWRRIAAAARVGIIGTFLPTCSFSNEAPPLLTSPRHHHRFLRGGHRAAAAAAARATASSRAALSVDGTTNSVQSIQSPMFDFPGLLHRQNRRLPSSPCACGPGTCILVSATASFSAFFDQDLDLRCVELNGYIQRSRESVEGTDYNLATFDSLRPRRLCVHTT